MDEMIILEYSNDQKDYLDESIFESFEMIVLECYEKMAITFIIYSLNLNYAYESIIEQNITGFFHHQKPLIQLKFTRDGDYFHSSSFYYVKNSHSYFHSDFIHLYIESHFNKNFMKFIISKLLLYFSFTNHQLLLPIFLYCFIDLLFFNIL